MKDERTNKSPSFQYGIILEAKVRREYGKLTLPISNDPALTLDSCDDHKRDQEDDPADNWKK